MLLRAAHWNCARRQQPLTLLKSLYVNGALSANPPPVPWRFEYGEPADCLKMRFVPRILRPDAGVTTPLTSSPTIYPEPPRVAGFMPFVVGLDTDSQGNLVKVVLTNQTAAIGVYTADISGQPDLWDSQFHTAAVSTLAAYLVNPLARNRELLQDQIAIASSALAAARATDGNEALPTQDHVPDWMRARMAGGAPGFGYAGDCIAGYDEMSFPGGLRF
jgi:hypothetical protein